MRFRYYWLILIVVLGLSAVSLIYPQSRVADAWRFIILKPARPLGTLGNFAGKIFSPIKSAWNWPSVVMERDALRAQVAELQSIIVSHNAVIEENTKLRKELELAERATRRQIACPVLGQSLNAVSQQLTLGCGSGQGVRQGLGVTLHGSLLGTVTAAGHTTSLVRLLLSPQSAVDVKVGSSSTVGIVRGSLGVGLVLDLLPTGAPIRKGDMVASSGIAGELAPDLAVGIVDEQISVENDPQLKFTVEPSAVWRGGTYALVVFP